MRATVLLTVSGLLLLPCAVMADDCCGVFGASFDFASSGDDGDGIGAGARFMFPAGCGSILLSGSLVDGESVTELYPSAAPRVISVRREDTEILSATASFVRSCKPKGRSHELFYGGGIGWYQVDGDEFEQDSLGGQVLGGVTFKNNCFFELRWVFGTKLDWGRGSTSDVDGVRFSIGHWCK